VAFDIFTDLLGFLVIQKEQVVLNLEAAPTGSLSNGTWVFQISRLGFTLTLQKLEGFRAKASRVKL
jgi:hypothetical protein